MKKKLPNFQSISKRAEQKSQGIFDGRYKQRVVKDKKKEENKNKAREKIKISLFLCPYLKKDEYRERTTHIIRRIQI